MAEDGPNRVTRTERSLGQLQRAFEIRNANQARNRALDIQESQFAEGRGLRQAQTDVAQSKARQTLAAEQRDANLFQLAPKAGEMAGTAVGNAMASLNTEWERLLTRANGLPSLSFDMDITQSELQERATLLVDIAKFSGVLNDANSSVSDGLNQQALKGFAIQTQEPGAVGPDGQPVMKPRTPGERAVIAEMNRAMTPMTRMQKSVAETANRLASEANTAKGYMLEKQKTDAYIGSKNSERDQYNQLKQLALLENEEDIVAIWQQPGVGPLRSDAAPEDKAKLLRSLGHEGTTEELAFMADSVDHREFVRQRQYQVGAIAKSIGIINEEQLEGNIAEALANKVDPAAPKKTPYTFGETIALTTLAGVSIPLASGSGIGAQGLSLILRASHIDKILVDMIDSADMAVTGKKSPELIANVRESYGEIINRLNQGGYPNPQKAIEDGIAALRPLGQIEISEMGEGVSDGVEASKKAFSAAAKKFGEFADAAMPSRKQTQPRGTAGMSHPQTAMQKPAVRAGAAPGTPAKRANIGAELAGILGSVTGGDVSEAEAKAFGDSLPFPAEEFLGMPDAVKEEIIRVNMEPGSPE